MNQENTMPQEHADAFIAAFLFAWLEWIKGGAVSQSFSREIGLCWALVMFYHQRSPAFTFTLKEKLRAMLKAEFNNMTGPFDSPGNDYFDEAYGKTMHLNQARIDWARKTLDRLSKEL